MGGLYDAATLLVLSVPGDTLKAMGTLSVATTDPVVAEIVRECCSAGVPGGVPWGDAGVLGCWAWAGVLGC